MKHKLIIGLSALFAISLAGCGENKIPECPACPECETCPEVHTHTFSNDWTHDVTNHWHAATCEHKDQIQGLEAHKYNDQDVCTVCGYKRELKITKQPESTLVELGSPTSFEVLVNDPSLVKSYQWKMVNVDDPDPFKGDLPSGMLGAESIVALDCASARTNKLEIPGPDFYGEKEYFCEIIGVNGERMETEKCHYTLKDWQPSDPFIGVGSRVVAAGQTLDLATTPFGSGKVLLNEEGTVLTLDHVSYSNTTYDYDPFDCELGMYFYCYQFLENSFTVKLIGDNQINNVYYEEDNGAGGVTFGLFFSGRGNKPTVSIEGEGSLTITGGSHSIYCNDPIEIHSNINMNSISNHWNAGIHGSAITVGEYVTIRANLTSYLFEANHHEDPRLGKLIFEKGSVVEAVITPVQNGQHGSTLDALSAITASYSTEFKNAIVNVNVIFDYKNLELGSSLPPTALICSNNKGPIHIKEKSAINLNVSTVNNSDETDIVMVNTISADGNLNIDNSTVRIVADAPHCGQFYGPRGNDIIIDSSNVYVDALALEVNCLAADKSVYMCNSTVEVKGKSLEAEATYGIVAITNITVDGGCKIHSVVDKGIAFGVFFGKGETEEKYDSGYEPEYIDVDASAIVLPGSSSINIYSMYHTGLKHYQYYETIYDTSDVSNPVVATEVYIID